jgi:hypothetical protein
VVALLVGLGVASSVWSLLAWFGLHGHQAGDVSILYGVMAGFVTYGGRLVLCRCPRCGRRLIGLWTLVWLMRHLRRGGLIRRISGFDLTRCPHCDTRFRWTVDSRPVQPHDISPSSGRHVHTSNTTS